MSAQLDHLDALALRVAQGDTAVVGPLSTGERLYVVLAANNMPLLNQDGYTVAEALARLGEEWSAQLIERWRYRGNPARQS